MKKFLLLAVLFFTGMHAYSQNPYPQEYDGCRSWSTFSQDTVRYLQYNWGIKTGGLKTTRFFRIFGR